MDEEYTTKEEFMFESREELKRVEHIIYVSLKYTRTTDVLRNALLRFISFFDMVIHANMIDLLKKDELVKIPRSPALKAMKFSDLNQDNKELQRFIVYYFFLKELLKNDYKKINEYRRYVGMQFEFEDNSVLINIDSLETCEYYAHQFYDFSRKMLSLTNEDED